MYSVSFPTVRPLCTSMRICAGGWAAREENVRCEDEREERQMVRVVHVLQARRENIRAFVRQHAVQHTNLLVLNDRVEKAREADAPQNKVADALRRPPEAEVVVLLVLCVLLDREVSARGVREKG